MTNITYELKNPFEYAHKGDIRQAGFITLFAPTVDNLSNVAKLKQGFMRAIVSQQHSSKSPVDQETTDANIDDFTGEMIMAMLAMSDIDHAAYLQTAKALFSDSGIAAIDGEEPLKKSLMSKMSVDDLEAMTGEYLKVFILTSVLEMMQT